MTSQRRAMIRGSAAVVLFVVSAAACLALLGIVTVSDLEGATFDAGIQGEGRMRLRCPVFLTSDQPGVVRATINNSLDRGAQYLVRVHVSEGFVTLFREINYQLALEPHSKQTLEWEVTAADAAYGWLTLVKVYQSASYPLPARTGSCGIAVVPIPLLSGNLFFALVLGASLLGMAVGIIEWRAASRASEMLRYDVSNAMIALGCALLVGMVIALMGSWILSLVAMILAVLLTLALLFYFLFKAG